MPKPKSSPKQVPVSTADLTSLLDDNGGYGSVLYGPSGVGKTSMVAYAPRVGFIVDPQEHGIIRLAKRKIVPRPIKVEEVESFDQLIETLDQVRKWGIQNLCLDSMTGMERLCFQYHCREYFDNDWSKEGFYAYQQGPKNAAKTDWPSLIDALNEVKRAEINIWFLAHSQVGEYKNPTGPNFDRYFALADKAIWGATHQWADAVLFYNYKIDLAASEGDRPAKKRKVEVDGVEGHFIYTQYSPAFDAKNQLGLPPYIDGGSDGKEAYGNFLAALNGK